MYIDRWDIVSVRCIKSYETLNPNNSYQIKGSGYLEYNADPKVNGKKGYGLCIEDSKRNRYYFTAEEMSEYFITEEEGYKQYEREQKFKDLGI